MDFVWFFRAEDYSVAEQFTIHHTRLSVKRCRFLAVFLAIKITYSQALCCTGMCVLIYVGLLLIGCLPCLHHYFCKKNALYHRHKFAKSCSRVWATAYNIFIVLFSITLTVTLIIINCVWLASVHAIGRNTVIFWFSLVS